MFYKKRVNHFVESQFGKNPTDTVYYDASKRLDKVRRFHNMKRESMELTDYVDDITWEDLEMDQMFLRINHTNSFFGEQFLYHKLHSLLDNRLGDESKEFEKHLSYLEKNEQERIQIESKLYGIGKKEEDYYLPEFLKNTSFWKVGNAFFYHLLQLLLVFFAVMMILTQRAEFIVAFAVMIAINMNVYVKSKQQYEIYLNSLGVFKQVYDFSAWMMEQERENEDGIIIPKKVKKAVLSLKKMSKLIFSYIGRKQNTVSGDLASLISDYLWGVLLLDVSMFNHIMKVIWDKQEEVMTILEFSGQIDSEIAVLSYRKSIDNWCRPTEIEKGIYAKKLVHPLVKNAVPNDFSLPSKAVFTGANASGKSTFMKAMAVNAILAQTIHTCTADEYALPKIYVMTCMALRDDVISGESYYFREAKYLKRMIDQIDQDIPMLCVIDEILKGTNTSERIAASKAILQYIENKDTLVMIATHDRELTDNPNYSNYHFESKIENNDVQFDYTLYNGVCEDSNAISLLKVLGYPEEIIGTGDRFLSQNNHREIKSEICSEWRLE